MPLIYCKVELKLKWTKYCVLIKAVADNSHVNSDNITFAIKDRKSYVPVVTLSARNYQKLSKRLSKGFERSVYWNEYKIKNENKSKTNEYRYLLESNFVVFNRSFVLVYENQDVNAKRFRTRRYYFPKDILKNCNVIINGKNFYDQPIDSDIN